MPRPLPPSKYAQILAFAKANPLPRTAEGLADALMDMTTILIACHHESKGWDSVDLGLAYRGHANPHPGAFLSNPAMLPNTFSRTLHGTCSGSLTAGCLFSYPYYHEDGLGPALLLTAFSPRTRKPQLSAALYARALILLKRGSLIASARLDGLASLAQAAAGDAKAADLSRCYFNMTLSAPHIASASASALRTDLAARCIELALSDPKPGLFAEDTGARLAALALGRSLSPPQLNFEAGRAPAGRPRI